MGRTLAERSSKIPSTPPLQPSGSFQRPPPASSLDAASSRGPSSRSSSAASRPRAFIPSRPCSPSRNAKQVASISRCSVGHSYINSDLSRAKVSLCPFCEDFLAEYRDLAASRNARLLTNVKTQSLSFTCSKHNNQTFKLTVKEVRETKRWCPKCAAPSAFHVPRPVQPLPRVVDSRAEQDFLFEQARVEFAGGKRKKPETALRFRSLQTAAAGESKKSTGKNYQQALVIRAAHAADHEPDEYWELLGLALELPGAPVEQLYRQAARLTHPDKSTHSLAADAFKKLNAQFKLHQQS